MASILYFDRETRIIKPDEELRASIDLKRRLTDLENARAEWDTSREAIIELIFPIREIAFESRERGEKVGENVYDGTGIDALQTYADGLQGNMISRAWQWFGLKMPERNLNEIYEIKVWLHDLEPSLYNEFRNSTFYDEVNPYLMDLGSWGTGYMFTQDMMRENQAFINCAAIHPFECYISENPWHEVNTLFRKYEIQYRALDDQFDIKRIPDEYRNEIENKCKNAPDEYIEICHAVFPRERWIEARMVPNLLKKYASIYFPTGHNFILEESGFDDFPYAVCRSRKNTKETYGRSPADAAYKDLKVLNSMGSTLLRAGQLAGDPPYNVPSEMKGKLKLKPRGYNYYEDAARIVSAINTGIQYPIGKDREDARKEIIHRHFHTNLFRMLMDSEREQTAYEVREKRSENAVLLGPQIGRIETEFLNPIFDRFFAIGLRHGRLPEPPPILQDLAGAEIEVDYLGPLSQMQKRLHKTSGPIRALQTMMPFVEGKPELMDLINWDELTRMILEAEGLPPDMILAPEEVNAIREQRQEQIEQAQATARAAEGAKAVPQLNEPVAAGSPLEKILQSA